MKNIHVLPTDKPSRLFYLASNLHLEQGQLISPKNYQNICITSDEKIKEGEYGLSKLNEIIKFHSGYDYRYYAKIILITDPKLIQDGVQAIPDEFLEWFVKNPSCEKVEVEYGCQEEQHWKWVLVGKPCSCKKITARIIIPKEEAKFGDSFENSVNIMSMANSIFGKKKEAKQETLEEAACIALGYEYDYWLKLHSKDQSSLVYIEVTTWCKGAEWQQERMYSEEEVWKLVNKLNETLNIGSDLTLEQWFEKFKKK